MEDFTRDNISHQEIQEAMRPPRYPDALHISKAMVNQLPLVSYSGPIKVVNNKRLERLALDELRGERILGFDTESRPAFRKGHSYPPSIVQMATADRVYVFQVGQIGGLDGLLHIFTDPDIIKTGVALHDDILRLKEIRDFAAAGFVDVVQYTKAAKIENSGLRGLVGLIFGERISKGAQVSNWATPTLTKKQLHYAATDAWMSRRLYMALKGESLGTK